MFFFVCFFVEWKTLKWKNSLRNKNDLCKDLGNILIAVSCVSAMIVLMNITHFFMIFFNGSVMQRTDSSNNFQNGGEGEHQLIPSVRLYSANEFFQRW